MWEDAYYGLYEDNNTDEARILEGVAVPCRICEAAFRRLRLTLRYCATCHKGFCDGEHGNFTGGTGAGIQRGRCIQCGPHA